MGTRGRRRPNRIVGRPRPAPGEPEHRAEPAPLPYLGPRTPAEWAAAWREAIANDPDTRAMLGLAGTMPPMGRP